MCLSQDWQTAFRVVQTNCLPGSADGFAFVTFNRQAQTLKAAVEDQIVKEGLVGIGIASAVVGVASLIIGLAFARR